MLRAERKKDLNGVKKDLAKIEETKI